MTWVLNLQREVRRWEHSRVPEFGAAGDGPDGHPDSLRARRGSIHVTGEDACLHAVACPSRVEMTFPGYAPRGTGSACRAAFPGAACERSFAVLCSQVPLRASSDAISDSNLPPEHRLRWQDLSGHPQAAAQGERWVKGGRRCPPWSSCGHAGPPPVCLCPGRLAAVPQHRDGADVHPAAHVGAQPRRPAHGRHRKRPRPRVDGAGPAVREPLGLTPALGLCLSPQSLSTTSRPSCRTPGGGQKRTRGRSGRYALAPALGPWRTSTVPGPCCPLW